MSSENQVYPVIHGQDVLIYTIVNGTRSCTRVPYAGPEALHSETTRVSDRLNAPIADFCPRCTTWNDPDGRTECRLCKYPI